MSKPRKNVTEFIAEVSIRDLLDGEEVSSLNDRLTSLIYQCAGPIDLSQYHKLTTEVYIYEDMYNTIENIRVFGERSETDREYEARLRRSETAAKRNKERREKLKKEKAAKEALLKDPEYQKFLALRKKFGNK